MVTDIVPAKCREDCVHKSPSGAYGEEFLCVEMSEAEDLDIDESADDPGDLSAIIGDTMTWAAWSMIKPKMERGPSESRNCAILSLLK